MTHCWNCKSEVADPDFCTTCGKIQPLLESIDFFRFLGFKELLALDVNELEHRFYDLSKKFHPDFYQNRTEKEQQISLEKASFLNKAYKTLKDPFSRAKYLLELMLENEKSSDKKNIPPDLLMEVMELHELIDSLNDEENEQKRDDMQKEILRIRDELRRKSGSLGVELINIFSKWDNVAEHWNGTKLLCGEHRNLLKEMNDILVIRQYIETLLHSIEQEIPEESI
ncbi:Fe-S protein assembly co-chaperone HscB [candidate division KSB1 bacterium]